MRYRDVHLQLMDEVHQLTHERLLAELGRRELHFYHVAAGLLAHDS
ncbi:hypothetical protein [Limnochorda pilosa]|uniref:Uncharacterized protein n=1 Tax=Limnochorda pilosa TaxID=1555112 RepID=A0A0K2SH91_LIMPI|nr:hypothetical protein [Limnochorda pilosa]BAS26407.1 hypothetical protein LIP_0550 [Limnochorda pilosa]